MPISKAATLVTPKTAYCKSLCNKHHGLVCMVQNDIHAPGTTVYEALEFSAQMRVLDLDKHKLKDFVDQVGPHPTTALDFLLLLAALKPCLQWLRL